jgi:hypothetical protein
MEVLVSVRCHLKCVMFGGDIADFEIYSLLLGAIFAMLGALYVISHHLSSEAPSLVYE